MVRTGIISSPKGPRFVKTEYMYQIFSDDLYNTFIKDYPEYKNISKDEFKRIWINILAPEIRKESIKNPLGLKLPFYNGELKLQWLPYRMKAPERKHKKETGEDIPIIYLNTQNKIGKVKWERRNAVRYNRWLQFYAFEPHREMEKMAKKRIDESNDIRVSRVTLGGAKYGLAPLNKKI
jgi:hypothetical protein